MDLSRANVHTYVGQYIMCKNTIYFLTAKPGAKQKPRGGVVPKFGDIVWEMMAQEEDLMVVEQEEDPVVMAQDNFHLLETVKVSLRCKLASIRG